MEELNEKRIQAALADPTLPVSVLQSVDSTSSECRRRLAAGETRCLILAEQQTAGRGRQGKEFFSPAGRGLYLSLMFSPVGGIPAADGFTSYAAVCVRRAIRAACGIECGIKWVNDLFYHGRKVCGILTEAVGETLIAGVGIDLLSGDLPAELESIAGALDCSCDRCALAAAITNGLLAWAPSARDFWTEYRSASIVLGRHIRFLHQGGEQTGLAVNLTADGRLIAETENGRICLNSGEISLLGYE